MDSLRQPVAGDDEQHQFCVEVMKRLNIQRRNEHLCDVILEVGSGDHQARLKAHKIVLCAASPFFYNALNIDMTEKKEGVIKLEQTSKAVMGEVLEYLYTGHVDINEQNVFDLLQLADFLIVPNLKVKSVEFISQTLSSSNCLMAYYSAIKYQCPDLQKQASDFMFANFMSVAKSEDFQNLKCEQVEEWISSDEIQVKSEEEVFHVISKWTEGRDPKECKFYELFRHVRVAYMSRSFVLNVVLPHRLVKGSAVCTEVVLNAMKEISSGREDCYFAKPPRICLKSYEDGLVVCGLDKTYCYIPSDNRCYKMADMQTKGQLPGTCMDTCHGKLYIMIISGDGDTTELKRYDPLVNSWDPMEEHAEDTFCAVVNFQGCLYFIGGMSTGGDESKHVHRYNPETNLWQEVAPMSVARWGVCAVADQKSLYAIAGKSGDELLDLVETYDPERNSWSKVGSTSERKMFSCGAIVKGKVFLFGGFLGSDGNETVSSCIEMYDPTSNVWSILQNRNRLCAMSAVSFKENIYVTCRKGDHISLYRYDFDKSELQPCASCCSSDDNNFPPWAIVTSLRIPKDILRTFVKMKAV